MSYYPLLFCSLNLTCESLFQLGWCSKPSRSAPPPAPPPLTERSLVPFSKTIPPRLPVFFQHCLRCLPLFFLLAWRPVSRQTAPSWFPNESYDNSGSLTKSITRLTNPPTLSSFPFDKVRVPRLREFPSFLFIIFYRIIFFLLTHAHLLGWSFIPLLNLVF